MDSTWGAGGNGPAIIVGEVFGPHEPGPIIGSSTVPWSMSPEGRVRPGAVLKIRGNGLLIQFWMPEVARGRWGEVWLVIRATGGGMRDGAVPILPPHPGR